ncbi:MAG: pyruvate dehydrogenase, partial [Bdellovibrionales bacterium]
FICVGTPSGVTLSPEGAQHGWKSDFQIPNQITWEPFFCQELDWIFCDAIKRHVLNDNEGRTGVLIRGVTRGVEQKDMLTHLKMQKRFKKDQNLALCRSGFSLDGATNEEQVESLPENEIMEQIRHEVLAGAYYLVDYRGYTGYEPGENVVHIFSMGSPTTEALKASETLLSKGIYANVIVVTSPDLLCGILAHENDYAYLKNSLGINSQLYLRGPEEMSGEELVTVSGKRIPIVSVHDGEAGLLDNLGSIIGVKQVSCAVRKHSKVGRPKDIYAYHGIDADSLVEAAGKALSETALEKTVISAQELEASKQLSPTVQSWTELWPSSSQTKH